MEIEQENKLIQKKEETKKQQNFSGSEKTDDESCDSYQDDSYMYEKKLQILHIPHLIIWKMINENDLKLVDMTLVGKDALNFLL